MTGTSEQVVPLRGLLSAEQQGARHWQARLLRSLSLLLLAALPVAAPVVMYLSGSLDLFRFRGILALLISIVCPALFLLLLLAKARTLRQEATERFWLVGNVLVVHDEDSGRRDYDLTRFPVTLKRQAPGFSVRGGAVRGWAELRIGDVAEGGCVVSLCDHRSGAWWAPQELRRFAAVLAESPIEVSRGSAVTLHKIADRLDLAAAAATVQGRQAHEALAHVALDPDPPWSAPPQSSAPSPEPADSARGDSPEKEQEREGFGPIARAILACTAAVLGVTSVLTGMTLFTLAGYEYPGVTGRTGIANVQSCERVGPVSRHGFGYWWRCRVEVGWDDGVTETFVEGSSRFTPDDQRAGVAVGEGIASERNGTIKRGPVPADEGPRHASLMLGGMPLVVFGFLGPYWLLAELGMAGYWLVNRLRSHTRAAPP